MPAAPAAGQTAEPPAPAPSGDAKETAGATTADGHKGHRHEPSDPYYCPMDTEETSQKAGTNCPVCQMEMVPRKK